MRPIHLVSLILLTLITACQTSKNAHKHETSETVMLTYRVKAGTETNFQNTLAEAWRIYRGAHLVFEHPHIIVSDKDKTGGTRVTEIFTWVSANAPDHAPDSVKKIWERMHALCEDRAGQKGLTGGEVELITPHPH